MRLKVQLPVISIIFLCFCFNADAQRRNDPWLQYGGGYTESGFAVAAGSYYDSPLGSLAATFKPAIGYTVNVLYYRDNFVAGVGIGYHSYSPKQDVFYYDDGSSGVGTTVWQNLPVYSLYLGAAYNVQVNNLFNAYIGADFGVYYTNYAYHSVDQFSDMTANIYAENLYAGPKAGVNFLVNQHVTAGIEAKFNVFTPSGNSNSDPFVGTVYKTYSVGVALGYRF